MWYNIFMWENFVYFLCCVRWLLCDFQLIAGHLRQNKLKETKFLSQINQKLSISNFLYPSKLHSLCGVLHAVKKFPDLVRFIHLLQKRDGKKGCCSCQTQIIVEIICKLCEKREFLMLACYLSAITEEVICSWVEKGSILIQKTSLILFCHL